LLGTGQGDYKTDYRPAGRSWTALDDPMSKSGDSRAIWTWLDDPGQRAACSKTAGCRFDSCPTCPSTILKQRGFTQTSAEASFERFGSFDNNTDNNPSAYGRTPTDLKREKSQCIWHERHHHTDMAGSARLRQQ